MQFSFKEIQEYFYKQQEFTNENSFSPFYNSEDIYNKIEIELNELTKDSDYCSVLIRSSIDNGICEIIAIYDYKNEIFINKWGKKQEKKKINDVKLKKILKQKPSDFVIINKTNLIVMGGTTEYIIKKIKNKTYYYANHYGDVDKNYKSLMDYFKMVL